MMEDREEVPNLFPPEIWLAILSHVPLRDLLPLKHVSSEFKQTIDARVRDIILHRLSAAPLEGVEKFLSYFRQTDMYKMLALQFNENQDMSASDVICFVLTRDGAKLSPVALYEKLIWAMNEKDNLNDKTRYHLATIANALALSFPLRGAGMGTLEKKRTLKTQLANREKSNLPQMNMFFNLAGVDLSYLDLRGIDFQCINLEGANLMHSNLTSVCLRYTNLTRANLINADLTKADLSRSRLVCADVAAAFLTNSILDEASLEGLKLLLPVGHHLTCKVEDLLPIVKVILRHISRHTAENTLRNILAKNLATQLQDLPIDTDQKNRLIDEALPLFSYPERSDDKCRLFKDSRQTAAEKILLNLKKELKPEPVNGTKHIGKRIH